MKNSPAQRQDVLCTSPEYAVVKKPRMEHLNIKFSSVRKIARLTESAELLTIKHRQRISRDFTLEYARVGTTNWID